MADSFLRIDNVVKAYDQHIAVNGASLEVPRGKIFGLLGPNGAGKTSIIRMITGITAPDTGEIWFDGERLAPHHTRRTGYMPEERGLYKKMKIGEQATYLLSLKGMPEAKAREAAYSWLERLGLGAWVDRNATDLSKGMQQKVQFIATVAHEPDLLILDEPFSGLDPVNAKLIEGEIIRLKKKGTTIIFSTHRLEQVEELCDHIALINKGEVMLQNEITQVRKQFQKPVYRIDYVGDPAAWQQMQGLQVADLSDKTAMVHLQGGQDGRDIMRQLIDSPLEILNFELHLPSLTEIFIELVTGKPYQPSADGSEPIITEETLTAADRT
jgi:ABC-2 type transport system ATP-binding protein